MLFGALVLLKLAAVAVLPLANAQTNLPDLGPGVFGTSTRIEIDAPQEQVWDAILDFAAYPNWNPFARSQVVADQFFIPLADQTPFEGARIIISAQIPPLPLTPPITNETAPNLLNSQISFENITFLQPDLGRVAWKQIDIPDALINATRWTAVSTVGTQTLYESAEVYNGALAELLGELYGTGLQEAFDAQATALKNLVEGTS